MNLLEVAHKVGIESRRVFVDLDKIAYLQQHQTLTKTYICFSGLENDYVLCDESIEELVAKINGKKN